MADPWLYKVFFAIPFDPPMRVMYECIRSDLNDLYGGRLEFAMGRQVVRPSKNLPDLEAFKAQNADLLSQFFAQISSSAIVIADLTNNNPNVHLELGIALSLNKNILRVCGRDLAELGSDIRGYEVDKYQSAHELTTKIKEYIESFLKIKDLPLSTDAKSFYRTYPLDQVISSPWGDKERMAEAVEKQYPSSVTLPIAAVRDAEVKVKFSFLWTGNEDSWFGISLRSASTYPWYGSYLANVRKSGSLELTDLPGTILNRRPARECLQYESEHTLHVKIDGGSMIASVDDDLAHGLEIRDLPRQSPGAVILLCFDSKVRYKEVQFVSRDTINFQRVGA